MKPMARKRSRRLPGAALLGGTLTAGLLLAGSTLAGMFLAGPAPVAEAGETNYVKSVSHDAISGVRLDEEVVITFNSAVLPSSVGPDTILIRTGSNNGEQASGRYVIGRFLYDKGQQRRVVIRPEAIQEYFQLIRGLSRSAATRKTE